MTRTVASRRNPTRLAECLQVAADRRLGKLNDRAELADRELMLFEQEQDAAADRIGQRRQMIENRLRRFHPYIRMKCYMRGGCCQAGRTKSGGCDLCEIALCFYV